MPDWMAELAHKAGASVGGSSEEKAEGDARWIGDFADELTIAIALRDWNQAVDLVEQGNFSSLPCFSGNLTRKQGKRNCQQCLPWLGSSRRSRLP
jgi:hypothetical protein